MPPDLKTATGRVAEARARLAHLPPNEASLREIEDVLADGYALALAGDAWLKRTERHLHELIDAASQPPRAGDLRALATVRGNFQRALVALRDELGHLRQEYSRVLGTCRIASPE